MRNSKLLLIMLMTMVLVTAPMLSVEASVKGVNEKLLIDLSDGEVVNGYFILPVDKSTDEIIFDFAYVAGYIDEKSNDFIGLTTRGILNNEWFKSRELLIPLNTKLLKINDIIVYSYHDAYHPEFYDVPFLLNGEEEIRVTFQFSEGRGTVKNVNDSEFNDITLKDGDVLLPIYARYKDGEKNGEKEFEVQQDKKIIYNDKLFAIEEPANADKAAFIIIGRPATADPSTYSDLIIPANFKSKVSSKTFTPSAWAKAEIEKAKSNGLTSESLSKYYQWTITRQEFCELVVRLYEKLSGKTAKAAPTDTFYDTMNDYVLKAYALGIVNGTGDGEFSPHLPLNREQMAKMFFNTLQLAKPGIKYDAGELSFTDKNDISPWAMEAVKYMSKEGIIQGSNNKFNPQQEASREQAIVLVNRVFEKYSK